MEAILASLLLAILFCAASPGAHGGVLLSSIPQSFMVTVAMNTSKAGVVEAGADELRVSWQWNSSSGVGDGDSLFQSVKSKLCYAPVSQVDRGWRKTHDDLHKDKTCQFKIATQPYSRTGNTSLWTVGTEIPGAVYFVRVYALNAAGQEVAYGQSTNSAKTTNLFTVDPITGRPKSLVIATACFSIFSVGALVTFFTIERRLIALKKAS